MMGGGGKGIRASAGHVTYRADADEDGGMGHSWWRKIGWGRGGPVGGWVGCIRRVRRGCLVGSLPPSLPPSLSPSLLLPRKRLNRVLLPSLCMSVLLFFLAIYSILLFHFISLPPSLPLPLSRPPIHKNSCCSLLAAAAAAALEVKEEEEALGKEEEAMEGRREGGREGGRKGREGGMR